MSNKPIINIVDINDHEVDKKQYPSSTEHISSDRLRTFANMGNHHDDDLEILEHISICDTCNEIYIQMMEDYLLELPTDFVENTMKQVKLINKNKVVTLTESRRGYYKYCMKVTFACACSLFLLFNIDRIYQEYTMKGDKTIGVTNSLQNGYEKMKNIWMDVEENKYEIKTK